MMENRQTCAWCDEAMECCGNCKHFVQHYFYYEFGCEARYAPMFYGHCKYPRFKNRKPVDYCDHFERREKETHE